MASERPASEQGLVYRPTDTPLVDKIFEALRLNRTATVNLVKARISFLKPIELVLLFEKKARLAYACAARPGKGSTGVSGARLFFPVRLDIPVSRLVSKLSSPAAQEFESKILKRSACRPTSDTWSQLIQAARELVPDASDELGRLLKVIDTPALDLSSEGAAAFHLQRDQLGVALDIAQIPRIKVLPEAVIYDDDQRLTRSIATSLGQRVREVPAIFADYRKWPGYQKIEETTDHAVFVHDNRRLDIYVTHDQPFENQIGSDLLYINHEFMTAVLVQYKMYDSSDKFRIDKQTKDEISRLRLFRSGCNLDPSHASPISDFRLSPDPCYFKLMQRKSVDVRGDHLIPGHYFPLWLWEGIWKDDVSKGPQGGRVIRRSPAPRHLCKSSFVGLVSNGWIGTKIIDTKKILEYISERSQSGASVMTAISSEIDADDFEFEDK